MSWHKIRLLVLALIVAFLVIFIDNVAVANDANDIHLFKMGTDVTVPQKAVITDAVAIDGSVTILEEGQVTEDAVAIGGDVILKSNARIDGDAVVIGGQIVKETGARVGGSEVVLWRNSNVLFERFGLLGTLYLTNVLFYLISLIVVFAVGILLFLLIPNQIQTVTTTIYQNPFKSGSYGLGTIVVIALFSGLFTGSVFGLLLIPIVNLALAVVGLLGAIAIALWIGQKIFAASEKAFFPFLVGMLILAAIAIVPIVGGLIILILNLFGIGAVLLSQAGTVKPEKIQKPLDRFDSLVQPSGS